MDINCLIKGRIAEVIFEEMFKEGTTYSVYPNGYEYTHPELAQYQHLVRMPKVLENIRKAPDFILVSNDKTKVYFVEVKFQRIFGEYDLVKIADDLKTHWDPCMLFLATPERFYYASCNDVRNLRGQIKPLNGNIVNLEIQKKYLEVMKRYIIVF